MKKQQMGKHGNAQLAWRAVYGGGWAIWFFLLNFWPYLVSWYFGGQPDLGFTFLIDALVAVGVGGFWFFATGWSRISSPQQLSPQARWGWAIGLAALVGLTYGWLGVGLSYDLPANNKLAAHLSVGVGLSLVFFIWTHVALIWIGRRPIADKL